MIRAATPDTENIWRTIASCTVTALFTGLCAWLSFGRDTVSRADLEKHTETASPWVRDKGAVVEAIGALKSANVLLLTDVASLKADAGKINVKLDRLIDDVNELKPKRVLGLKVEHREGDTP